MKRRWAIPLAFVWLIGLLIADGWILSRSAFLHERLEAAAHEILLAPIAFGDLTVAPFQDVVIPDVRLMRPDRPSEVYATVDEIRIRISWSALIFDWRLVVDELIVRKPSVNVTWAADKSFDMPTPIRSNLEVKTHRPAGELPIVRLAGLHLVLRNSPYVLKPNQELAFDNLSLVLTPEGSQRWLYRFDADVDNPMTGQIHAHGNFSSNDFVLNVQRHGFIDVAAIAPAMREEFSSRLKELVVTGGIELSADVARDEKSQEFFFTADVTCDGVSARVKRWPQEITDLRGQIHYELGRISTKGLTARFEGAPMEFAGFYDLSGSTDIVQVNGALKRLQISNEFGRRVGMLPDPCPTIREQILAWNPDGYADLGFRLEQKRAADGTPGLLRPFIDVEFRGGSTIRYEGQVGDDGERHGFPYPLEDVRGVLHFDDVGMHFDRVTALNGTLLVEARGKIDYEHYGDEAYDVDISALGLKLDDRVSAALHGDGKKLFNDLDADGMVNLAVAVKRKKSEPPGARLEVIVEPQGMSAQPRSFPLPFEDARGRIVIGHDDVIRVEELKARYRGGELSLTGRLGVAVSGGDLRLDLGFEKFPVDVGLIEALKVPAPDAARQVERLNARGLFSGKIRVARMPNAPRTDVTGAFRFEKLTLAPEDPSVRIDELDGMAEITTTALRLQPGTTGRVCGEKFAIEGTIGADGVLDLTVEAGQFHFGRKLVAELEPLAPWLREVQDRFAIDGPMSARVEVHGPVDRLLITADLEIDDVVSEPPGLPGVRFENIRAKCHLASNGVVTVRDLVAWVPPPTSATSRPAPETRADGAFEPERRIAFEVAEATWTPRPMEFTGLRGQLMIGPAWVRRLPLEPWVLDALPVSAETRAKLNGLRFRGITDLTIGSLTIDSKETVATGCQLKAWGLTQGERERIRADYAEVQKFSLTSDEDGLKLSGRLALDGATLFGVPVPRLRAKASIGSGSLVLTAVDADLIGYEPDGKGGKVPDGKIDSEQTRFELRLGDGGFLVRVDLRDVNFPAVVRALGASPGKVRGLMRGFVELSGVADDPATYSGHGELTALARNLIEMPVFYKLFNSLDLLSYFQGGDGRTSIKIGLDVKDRVVQLPAVRIDAPELTLDGTGRLTFEGIIHADLKASQTVGLSPIGWITDLISAVVFAGVTIDGPIEDPQVGSYSLGGGADSDPTSGRRPKLKPLKE